MTSLATHSTAAEQPSRNHPRPSWPRCPPPRSAPHMKTSEQTPEPRTAGSRAVGHQARIPAHLNPYRLQLHTQHAWPVLARSNPNPRRPFAQATPARASRQASPGQLFRPGPNFFAPNHEKAKQGCFTKFQQQPFGTLMSPFTPLVTPPAGSATTPCAFVRLEVSHG